MSSEIMARLLEKVARTNAGGDGTINDFWRTQLDRLRMYLGEAGATQSPLNVEMILEALGYNEKKLPEGVSNRQFYIENGNVIALATDWLPRQQKAFHGSLPGGKSDIEHLCSLMFLQRKGLLDEYLEFADAMGLVSSMSMARHWWYCKKLKPHLNASSMRVVEIGAGSGFFASMVMRGPGWDGEYIIVDLPEMLLNSVANLTRQFPDVAANMNSAPQPGSKPSLHYFETTNIELIETGSVDVALNFNSFMEMSENTRNYYIRQIYRICKPGALFYNVNRMQRKMGSDGSCFYENNPLRYPYEQADQIIEWEPDEFQQDYRSRFAYGAVESFAISSLRKIHGCPVIAGADPVGVEAATSCR